MRHIPTEKQKWELEYRIVYRITNINARCSLLRFFSFLPLTLPSLGCLRTNGSPGTYFTQAYGPAFLNQITKSKFVCLSQCILQKQKDFHRNPLTKTMPKHPVKMMMINQKNEKTKTLISNWNEEAPGGFMPALFLRGLSLGLRLGNRVSVKL